MKLLIVDDEAYMREFLFEELSLITSDIVLAKDGEEALNTIWSDEDRRIDAVLSDVTMPKMTGLEVLKAIRSAGRDLPFVIMTAFSDRDKTLEALRLGAFDFIDKPFDLNKLSKIVRSALELGVHIRETEHKIAAMVRESGMTQKQIDEFKTQQLEILKKRYTNRT